MKFKACNRQAQGQSRHRPSTLRGQAICRLQKTCSEISQIAAGEYLIQHTESDQENA